MPHRLSAIGSPTALLLFAMTAHAAVDATLQTPGTPAGPPVTAGAPQPGQPVPAAPGIPGPARDRRPGDNPRGTSAIRGIVVAADSGTPLRRVQVRAFSQTGGGSGIAQTDADGRFEIAQLAAGRYVVSAMRSGYVNLQFGQRAPNQPGTPVEIAEGQILDRVNFALPRGGAISGRIVDELGEPVASVEVLVRRFAFMGGARRLVPAGGQGGNDRTDDLGQFRLYGLPPGEYYVSATLRAMDFMGPTDVPQAGQSDGYAPTYFPGTTSVGEARRVTVRAGQDVPNVSFALVSARLGRISGKVTTSAGEPYTEAMLMIAPRNDHEVGFGFNMTGAQVRGDGTFSTPGLPPGTYTITVQPRGGPFGPAANGEVARMDVPVNGEDVRDVFIVSGAAGIIRGRLTTDDGSVPPFRPGQVRIFAAPRDPSRPMMGMRPSVVRDDWTFEVSGLTDAVRLNVNFEVSGGGWSARHAWKDNVDLLDTAVDIGPGQTLDGVDLVVTSKVTEVSGTVTDARNQPITDASVVIFPENQERWSTGSRYLRLSRPDTNGKYATRLTPADGYRAIVVRGLEDGQFADPEFLARALEYATPFDIGEGETKSMNLRLTDMK